MFYTIYKITNQINGKFYIGSHKTKDLDDNYMGSGKYLKHAQDKYGMENFTKEILFVFDNPEEMYAKEAEIVNEDFIAEENTYNIKVGGHGGFEHININANSHDYVNLRRDNGNKSSTKGYVGVHNKRKNDPGYHAAMALKAKETKERNSLEKFGDAKECYRTFKGKTHSDDTKKKISDSKKARSCGDENSQYGTMWITNGVDSRKIGPHDVIPQGWYRGRKMKQK